MTPSTKPSTYLGDGVYASYDGYQIILELSAQTPPERIALEPAVFENLLAFSLSVNPKHKSTS